MVVFYSGGDGIGGLCLRLMVTMCLVSLAIVLNLPRAHGTGSCHSVIGLRVGMATIGMRWPSRVCQGL